VTQLEINSAVPMAPADVPTLPPAMQRRLGHLATVKSVRSTFAVATGGLFAAAALAFAVPATAAQLSTAGSASIEAQQAEASPQSLIVAATSPLAAVARDAYSAVLPPPLQYPVAQRSAVASGYGPRECSNCHSNFHHGIDIFPGAGTPVAAMASGVVSKAYHSTQDSMGVTVAIDHVVEGVPVTSVYGHLQDGSMTLNVGDRVAVGDIIGLVGATGNANGAHLHFEVHPGGGGSVNPYEWLAARIG
jgi:murein DD-endopeptidase MepM/ murein hydrolase activator NlpD